MAVLKPFRGVRPPKELVLKVAAPPYDVVSAAEARTYAQGNAHSFFHVSRPEIDLPEHVDEHADEVYRKGAENLRAFIERGWLKQDDVASFYVYRQRMGDHAQVGIVAGASVDEYDRALIKKHELTRADKEDDRTRHIDELAANDEPVFLTYRKVAAIDEAIASVTAQAPEYDFTTEDRIAHTFWVVRGVLNERLAKLFDSVTPLYIADGHHRSAAASRVRKLFQDRGEGNGEHDFFLAVVFPHDQLKILDYNRLVKDLKGRTPQQFVEAVQGAGFDVTPAAVSKPDRVHQFGMFLDGKWHRLTARPEIVEQTPTGILDVSILQNRLLGPVLGIGDPRTDRRIAFVGGIRGTGELEKRVSSGEFAVAFSMFPTSLEQLMAIADAGEIMPPKSTWFEPKLRSGLVLHLLR